MIQTFPIHFKVLLNAVWSLVSATTAYKAVMMQRLSKKMFSRKLQRNVCGWFRSDECCAHITSALQLIIHFPNFSRGHAMW